MTTETTEIKVPFITDYATYVTIVFDGKTHTLRDDHPFFTQVLENLKAGKHEEALQLGNIRRGILKYAKGNITLENDVLSFKGMPIHNTLTVRIMAMIKQGDDVEPMLAFMENLMGNPSKTAIMELYDFLEVSQMPITPDGHFLAYKKVRGDFMDIYTGTIRNAPGDTVSMERNAVEDDRRKHCSYGLHFAARSYMSHYGSNGSGDKIVLVKINPADVVSIPDDYGFAKGRCCRYEVIADITDTDRKLEQKTVVYSGGVTSTGVSDPADDWEEEAGESEFE